jgi:hypothetical protein
MQIKKTHAKEMKLRAELNRLKAVRDPQRIELSSAGIIQFCALKLKDHFGALAGLRICRKELCNSLKHSGVSNPGTAAPSPRTQWITSCIFFNLQLQLKPVHET